MASGVIQGVMQTMTGLGAVTNELVRNVTGLGGAFDALGGRLAIFGQLAGGVATIAAASAAAIGGIGVASVKGASDFQEAMVRFQNAGEMSNETADSVQKDIIGTAGSWTFGATEIANAGATIAGQLRVVAGESLTEADAMKVLDASQQLAVERHISLDKAASALSLTLIGSGKAIEDVNAVEVILSNTAEMTGQSVTTLANNMTRMRAITNLSTAEVGALTVTVQQAGLELNSGMMGGVQRVGQGLDKLEVSTKNAVKVQDALKISVFDSTNSLKPLDQILDQLHTSFGNLSEKQQLYYSGLLFGSGTAEVMRNVINNLNQTYKDNLTKVQDGAHAQMEYDTALNTSVGAWNQFRASLEAAGIMLGSQILPKITPIIKAFAQELPTAVETVGPHFIHLAEVVGTVMGDIVSVIGQAVMVIAELFGWADPTVPHSPSLVENWITAKESISQSALAMKDGIVGAIDQIIPAIQKLNEAAHGMTEDPLNMKQVALVAKELGPTVAAAYSEAVTTVNELIDKQKIMSLQIKEEQGVVDGLRDSMEKAQAQVTKDQDAIRGTELAIRRQNDAIRTLEDGMQQYTDSLNKANKALQTQQDVVTNLQDKLQALTAQLSDAKTQLNDLANSPIQGESVFTNQEFDINEQLNKAKLALVEQQQALGTNSSDLLKPFQNTIDDLQRKLEKLQLQESIQFDPLKKQIVELKNTNPEQPFDAIVAGMKAAALTIQTLTPQQEKLNDQYITEKAALEPLKKAVQDATDAKQAYQDKIDAARKALEPLNKTLEDEQQKLQDDQLAVQKASEAHQKAADQLTKDKNAYSTFSTIVADAKTQLDNILKSAQDLQTKGSTGLQNFGGAASDAFAKVGGGAKTAWEGMNKIDVAAITAKYQGIGSGLDDLAKKFEGFSADLRKWADDTFGGQIVDGSEELLNNPNNPFDRMVQNIGKWIQTAISPGGVIANLAGELIDGMVKAIDHAVSSSTVANGAIIGMISGALIGGVLGAMAGPEAILPGMALGARGGLFVGGALGAAAGSGMVATGGMGDPETMVTDPGSGMIMGTGSGAGGQQQTIGGGPPSGSNQKGMTMQTSPIYNEMSKIAQDALNGLVQAFAANSTGSKNVKLSIQDTINKNVVQAAKDTLEEESPSKVFIKIGDFVLDGLLLPFINRAASAAVTVTTFFTTAILNVPTTLLGITGGVSTVFTTMGTTITSSLQDGMTSLQTTLTTAATNLSSSGVVDGIKGGLGSPIGSYSSITQVGQDVITTISTTFSDAKLIQSVISSATSIGGAIITGIQKGLSGLANMLKGAITGALTGVLNGIGGGGGDYNPNPTTGIPFDQLPKGIQNFFNDKFGGNGIGQYNTFPQQNPILAQAMANAAADGGLFTSPTIALIGEDGPEAVVPLSKNFGSLDGLLGTSTSSKPTVVVQVSGNYILDDRTAQGLADKIGKVIAQTMLPAAGAYPSRF